MLRNSLGKMLQVTYRHLKSLSSYHLQNICANKPIGARHGYVLSRPRVIRHPPPPAGYRSLCLAPVTTKHLIYSNIMKGARSGDPIYTNDEGITLLKFGCSADKDMHSSVYHLTSPVMLSMLWISCTE